MMLNKLNNLLHVTVAFNSELVVLELNLDLQKKKHSEVTKYPYSSYTLT